NAAKPGLTWPGHAAEIGQHLSGGVDRQSPGLQADDPVRRDSTLVLGSPDRGGRVWAVVTVGCQYGIRARREVAATLVERHLQLHDPLAVRALAERGRIRTIACQGRPGSRPDDPVHGQTSFLLELLPPLLGRGTENAIDLAVVERATYEQVLKPPHVGSGRTL